MPHYAKKSKVHYAGPGIFKVEIASVIMQRRFTSRAEGERYIKDVRAQLIKINLSDGTDNLENKK